MLEGNVSLASEGATSVLEIVTEKIYDARKKERLIVIQLLNSVKVLVT